MSDMFTPNFSVSEMSCRCCGKEDMDSEFMRMLQELRNEVGPLRITSGFRCEDHNERISSTGRHGPHTEAKASDILISGEQAMMLFEKARQIGFSGIDVSHKGPHHKRFVHVDTLKRKALWSY